jgi:predicted nucleic acid-binding protein
MNVAVVDASALAAVLFDEPEALPVRASIRSRLVAPGLIRYELASVFATKMLRHPERAQDIRQRHALLDALQLDLIEPEWAGLPDLARRWALSAYDAAYLQLALALDAPLITLDARLAAAHDAATGIA